MLGIFDDPYLQEKKWVSTYEHPHIGKMEAFGRLVDFSETPGDVQYPPLTPGQHSREILADLGYGPDEIESFIAQRAVGLPSLR